MDTRRRNRESKAGNRYKSRQWGEGAGDAEIDRLSGKAFLMRREHRRSGGSRIVERIKRWFTRRPESPDDPYALVTAPTKPRPPHRRASVAELPER